MREINLLPPDRRKMLRNESVAISLHGFLRSINIGLTAMTVAAGIIIGSLFALSYTAALTTEQELQRVSTEYQTLRDSIARQNQILEYVAALGRERVTWSNVLRDFLSVVPPGVTVSQMNGGVAFSQGVISGAQLSFDGQAVTRSTLVIYEERLKALESVSQVTSPTSNLLERNNPIFQFDVVLRTNSEL